MMSLWLLLVLFIACGVVVFAYQRLMGVSDRLKDLQDDLARNDEQLRRHLTRLQAIEEASREEAASGSGDNSPENIASKDTIAQQIEAQLQDKPALDINKGIDHPDPDKGTDHKE